MTHKIQIREGMFSPNLNRSEVTDIVMADIERFDTAHIRDHGGGDFRKELKAAIFARDNFRCVYCGIKWDQPDIKGGTFETWCKKEKMTVTHEVNADGNFRLELDHIYPRRAVAIMEAAGVVEKDFLNSPLNVATCCPECNNRKGTLSPSAFINHPNKWSSRWSGYTRKNAMDAIEAIEKMSSYDLQKLAKLRFMIKRVSGLTSPGKKLFSASQGKVNTNQKTIMIRLIAKAFMNRPLDYTAIRMSAHEQSVFHATWKSLKPAKKTLTPIEAINAWFVESVAAKMLKNEVKIRIDRANEEKGGQS